MTTARDIVATANAYGIAGFHDKTADQLRAMLCTLASEFKSMEHRYLGATFPSTDDGSRTAWTVVDKSEGAMRYVWIAKRLTKFVGMEFEETSEELVMLVDRKIAEDMARLLNSQLT
jgi:hypothetical protein